MLLGESQDVVSSPPPKFKVDVEPVRIEDESLSHQPAYGVGAQVCKDQRVLNSNGSKTLKGTRALGPVDQFLSGT